MLVRCFSRRAGLLILLAIFLAVPTVVSAQRAAVSRKSAQKRASKKAVKNTRAERDRDRDRDRAKRAIKIDEASNAVAQAGPSVKPEMTFLGESPTLSSLAARPEKLARGNDAFFENENEEVFEF